MFFIQRDLRAKCSNRAIRLGTSSISWVICMFAIARVLPAQESVDSAPPMTVTNSHVHNFRSSINGRPYRIIVRLPQAYSAHPEARYPLLYMTDGVIALPTAVTAYQVQNGGTDSLIFVGIAYSDAQAMRYYDGRCARRIDAHARRCV